MARLFIKRLAPLAPVVPVTVHHYGRKDADPRQGTRPCTSHVRCQEAVATRARMSHRPSRVAVVGDVFVDVMAKVQGLPEWDIDVEAEFVKVLPGGSALNGARHLHALGAEVRFFGAVGDDGFGKMLLAHVSGQGFPTDHFRVLPAVPSSVCMVLTGPKDRAMVSCYSSTSAFSPTDLQEQVATLLNCDHLHIGGYYNMKGLQNHEFTALVKRCREHGMTVSMNTQYAASEDWLGRDGHLLNLLPLVDFLFVSGVESEGISTAVVAHCQGKDNSDVKRDTPGTAEQLCTHVPGLTAVVTRGAEGCDVVSAGSSTIRVPTAPVEEVVDATGAGDAFFAGFLLSWLSQNRRSDLKTARLDDACKMGHAVARVVVGREGACVQPVRLGDISAGLHHA